MHCPNCNQEIDDGMFCPECGTKLIEKPKDGVSISLGDANAGDVHLADSHNVHNEDKSVHNITNTTSTVNNITQMAAQKTEMEILQENEKGFIKAVRERVAKGFTRQIEAELDQLARDWKIQPEHARQIIEAERKTASILTGSQGNEYYVNKVLQNVFDAVNANQTEIVKRLFKTVEELSKTVDDANLHYYYYMLLASLNPASCTVSFVNHHTDNYWQLFWTCIAYVKLGQVQNAVALIPRLGGFGCPHGDVDLLTAVENLHDLQRTKNDYYRQQLQNNLKCAIDGGISEQLGPLWHAVQELAKSEQNIEEWFAFYASTTLMELSPKKETKTASSMPQMPKPPTMPKFDPQAVQLKQSQGWNPLQAAQQMKIGHMPSMQETQAQFSHLQNQMMVGMPPMPNSPGGMPPMPATPSMETPPLSPEPDSSSGE